MAETDKQVLVTERDPSSRVELVSRESTAGSAVAVQPQLDEAVTLLPQAQPEFVPPREAGATLRYVLVSLRPRQWVKNLFVVAPLFFSKQMADLTIVVRVLAAFALFCLFSSSIYLINDVIDLEKDKKHPEKSRRPLASGLLSVRTAIAAATLLLALAATGSFCLDKRLLLVGAIYWSVNLLYAFSLKHFVIIDVICIATGFVLRVVAGGIAVQVPSSHWILTTTIFLSLFLGFGKRKGEIALSVGCSNDDSRPVLRNYSVQLLDQFLVVCATASIMSYALFALSDYTFARFGTRNLVYTTPFVIFGIFRYFYLIEFTNFYENPTEALFTDRPLMLSILLWVACVVTIIYLL
jgi:4-hydroxybenzoate polyprenyltransferase